MSKQVNSKGTRVFMGVITGGVDVHEALIQTAVSHQIKTATFELLGGLHEVTFTAYNFERQERQEPIVLERPLEIVSGHGTISLLEDRPHVHLHLSVSFRDTTYPHGIGLIGGHVANAIAFAVEYTIIAFEGGPMRRTKDEDTGLMLWG